MALTLRYALRSDVGLLRDSNQDSGYAGPRLLAVADGMGGHAAGDVASKVVIATLSHLDEDAPGGDLVDTLRKATAQANDLLRDMIVGDPDLDGMGTTLTALLFSGSRLGLVHVGDSRGYLYRGGRLTQITHDDTFVQSLVDEGRISADEASSHPQRSLLLRVLTGSAVEPDYAVREAVAGDRYLLCSDGLSGVVSDETIAEALQIEDPEEAADRLVELALRGGGPDNVTVIVADIVEGSYGDDQPVVAGAVAEGRGQREPTPDTAAGRAALTRPAPPPVATEPVADVEPRHRARWILGTVVVLLLLGGLAYAGWSYVQAQYYVGASKDGKVSVLRGVSGSIKGLSLHSVDYQSDIALTDLQPVARRQVLEGIPAADRADAFAIVARLREQELPVCPSPSPTPTSPTATAAPTATPSPRSTAGSPAPSPTPPPMVPGRDCRTAGS